MLRAAPRFPTLPALTGWLAARRDADGGAISAAYSDGHHMGTPAALQLMQMKARNFRACVRRHRGCAWLTGGSRGCRGCCRSMRGYCRQDACFLSQCSVSTQNFGQVTLYNHDKHVMDCQTRLLRCATVRLLAHHSSANNLFLRGQSLALTNPHPCFDEQELASTRRRNRIARRGG